MARHETTIATIPAPLVEALQLALAQTPRGEGEMIAQREIVRSLQEALDARRHRLIVSQSSINGVKWACLTVQAILLLVATAMAHIDDRTMAALAMAIFATAIAASVVLIAAHARPFAGEISVGPDVLLQVMPKATVN